MFSPIISLYSFSQTNAHTHTHISRVKWPHQHIGRGKEQEAWTIPLPAGATSIPINLSTARGCVCTSVHLCACVSSHLRWHAHHSLTETQPQCIINLPSDSHLSTHWSVGKCSSRGFNQAMGGPAWHTYERGLDKYKDKKTDEKWDIGTLSNPRQWAFNYQWKQINTNFSDNSKVIKGVINKRSAIPVGKCMVEEEEKGLFAFEPEGEWYPSISFPPIFSMPLRESL